MDINYLDKIKSEKLKKIFLIWKIKRNVMQTI